MKPTNNKNNKSVFRRFSTEYEKELAVAEILLDLGNIIACSEKFTWGGKRKRSASKPAATPAKAVVANEVTRVKLVENNLASPNTTLAFLPSESDETNNNGLMESLKKMTKEECVKMEEQLIQSRECLQREVENMKRFRNELKEENSQLKAKKEQVLKSFQTEEKPQMEENVVVNYFGNNMVPYHNLKAEVQVQNIEHRFDFTNQLDVNGHGPVNQVGPRGIPDLNLMAEEAYVMDVAGPLDIDPVEAEKRERFAEARKLRRMRRGKIKIKAMRIACGITLPTIN